MRMVLCVWISESGLIGWLVSGFFVYCKRGNCLKPFPGTGWPSSPLWKKLGYFPSNLRTLHLVPCNMKNRILCGLKTFRKTHQCKISSPRSNFFGKKYAHGRAWSLNPASYLEQGFEMLARLQNHPEALWKHRWSHFAQIALGWLGTVLEVLQVVPTCNCGRTQGKNILELDFMVHLSEVGGLVLVFEVSLKLAHSRKCTQPKR